MAVDALAAPASELQELVAKRDYAGAAALKAKMGKQPTRHCVVKEVHNASCISLSERSAWRLLRVSYRHLDRNWARCY